MDIHAAMVDRMDREIGRVLEQLRAMGAFENTLIFFLSDNGASAEIMVRDDGHDPAAAAGLGGLAPVPGAGLVHRGQHAVPPAQDLGPRRRHRDALDRPLAAGASPPAASSATTPATSSTSCRRSWSSPARGRFETWNGQDVPRASWQEPGAGLRPRRHGGTRGPVVAARRQPRHPRRRLEARRRRSDAEWELYDLAHDRTETHNLASAQPEKVRALERLWQQRRDEFYDLARRDVKPGPAVAKPAREGR